MYQEIEKLLEKYYEGETTLQDEKELRDFFNKKIVPSHLQHHVPEFRYYVQASKEVPSEALQKQITSKIDKKGRIIQFTSLSRRIAAGIALLLGGFAMGYLYQTRDTGNAMTANVPATTMKKVLQYEQVSLTSASERIDAVNQSMKLSALDQELVQLLINTLNFDDNVNVRLAACQALAHFENEPLVREGLIQSLKIQTDPNIQITLIEVLVFMKEKRASQAMEQLSQDKQTMDIVRLKAEEAAAKLKGYKQII